MPPLLVLVGETGSGKTALAIELAERFSGEIISADSRTVYTGMDIGTAKPSLSERGGIKHYGFDVVLPNEHFNAYNFQQLARSAIDAISAAGKLPIMVGGTGLYINAVIYDYHFRPQSDTAQRMALADTSVEELQRRVVAAGLPLPNNAQNPRHLTRLLEGGAVPKQPRRLRANTLVLGLQVNRETLRSRLEIRIDTMLKAGLIDEARKLYAQYGEVEALRTPGYSAFVRYIRGSLDLAAAKKQFLHADLQLAKRQRTWFRNNPDIHWLERSGALANAEAIVSAWLADKKNNTQAGYAANNYNSPG